MTHLNRSTLPAGHLIGASAPETTGIVHFRLGSFHRAHAAVYTALAMAAEPGDWGIVGVANRSHRVTDTMGRCRKISWVDEGVTSRTCLASSFRSA